MPGTLLVKNLNKVQNQIAEALSMAGRPANSVKLLGVSKYHSAEKVLALHSGGLRRFGESNVDEFLSKKLELGDQDIEWHFVGQLQSNKAKKIVGLVDLIHSVDRESLAKELNKRADHKSCIQDILIQINVGHESSKGGVLEEDGPALLERLQGLCHLRIRGLMAMPPIGVSEKESRKNFSRVFELGQQWKTYLNEPHLFTEYSMGTSGDYVNGILEGSTIVRLGSVIFGLREKR